MGDKFQEIDLVLDKRTNLVYYLGNMNMKMNDTFPTSDLPLATFLYASGILLKEIQDIPNEYRKKVFVFSTPPDELLASYQSGTADINVLALNNAQNTLKGLVNKR